MHYFFCCTLKNVSQNDCVTLDKEEAQHLFRILRAQVGDRVGLMDGEGTRATAVVTEEKTLAIETIQSFPIPPLRLHLYVAAPRKQKMEQLLKQATELGVWRVVTIQCQRSVALPSGERIAKRVPDLLAEACKQSGNPFLPIMEDPVKFSDALQDAAEKCQNNFFGDPAIDGNADPLTGDVGYFVGPEGGFSPEEIQAMRDAGFRPLRIGHWILRVETAATAGLAVLAAKEAVS